MPKVRVLGGEWLIDGEAITKPGVYEFADATAQRLLARKDGNFEAVADAPQKPASAPNPASGASAPTPPEEGAGAPAEGAQGAPDSDTKESG